MAAMKVQGGRMVPLSGGLEKGTKRELDIARNTLGSVATDINKSVLFALRAAGMTAEVAKLQGAIATMREVKAAMDQKSAQS